ncbi:DUF924 family protein [Vibrio lentus]|nr:DUF924 family protein [Vibrio lentus]
MERFGRYPHRNEVLLGRADWKRLSSCSKLAQAFNC